MRPHRGSDPYIVPDLLPDLSSYIQKFQNKDLKIIVYPKYNPGSSVTYMVSGLNTMRWDEGQYSRKLVVVGKDGKQTAINIAPTATNLKFCSSTPEPPKQIDNSRARIESPNEIRRRFEQGLVQEIHIPVPVDLPFNQNSELKFYSKDLQRLGVDGINRDLVELGFTGGEVEIHFGDNKIQLYKGSLASSAPLVLGQNKLYVCNKDGQRTDLKLPRDTFIKITKVAEVVDEKPVESIEPGAEFVPEPSNIAAPVTEPNKKWVKTYQSDPESRKAYWEQFRSGYIKPNIPKKLDTPTLKELDFSRDRLTNPIEANKQLFQNGFHRNEVVVDSEDEKNPHKRKELYRGFIRENDALEYDKTYRKLKLYNKKGEPTIINLIPPNSLHK